MKLKVLAILLLGSVIANTSLANEKPAGSYQTVVEAFVSSFLNNDYKQLKGLLSDDAIYSFNRNVNVLKHDANSILSEMKKNQGVKQQDCNINSTIITATEAMVMAQVDISYAASNNKQKNYLVLEKSKDGEWKITNVYKFFLNSNEDIKEKKNVVV